jgi:ribosome-associated translation inhibitor RaiA
MQTPLHIEVQGFLASTHLRETVAANVEKFEARHGRITSCRVAVRSPGQHHRMGEPYLVSIHMALPNGVEVNVRGSARGNDPRQADLAFAIADAFRRAVRQTREHARRLQAKSQARTST